MPASPARWAWPFTSNTQNSWHELLFALLPPFFQSVKQTRPLHFPNYMPLNDVLLCWKLLHSPFPLYPIAKSWKAKKCDFEHGTFLKSAAAVCVCNSMDHKKTRGLCACAFVLLTSCKSRLHWESSKCRKLERRRKWQKQWKQEKGNVESKKWQRNNCWNYCGLCMQLCRHIRVWEAALPRNVEYRSHQKLFEESALLEHAFAKDDKLINIWPWELMKLRLYSEFWN